MDHAGDNIWESLKHRWNELKFVKNLKISDI